MKMKPTNVLRGKERKKVKKERCAKLNRGRWWKFVYIKDYTYTPISKIKTVQQKLSTIIDWPGEQKKPKIISIRTKLIKAQTGKLN